MQIRKSLTDNILELKKETMSMANLSLEALKKAFITYETGDQTLGLEVMKADDAVDAYEESIAKQALKVLWREQPVAKDLRFVTGILKMITDIERIGDHAADIAYMTKNINHIPDAKVLKHAKAMMNNLETMYVMTIEALDMSNTELAKKVIQEDESVNALYKKAITDITNMIKEDTLEPEEAVYSLMVLKYLEKVGDHATNIAEWIIFTLTGIHKRTELY
jgi:phosphate transport system protein